MKFVAKAMYGNRSAFCRVMKRLHGGKHATNENEHCGECGVGPLTTDTSDHMGIDSATNYVTLCLSCSTKYIEQYEPEFLAILLGDVVGA